MILQTISEDARTIYEDMKSKGFWDNERNVGEMLMLVTSELGEAMEAHRKGKFFKGEKLIDGDKEYFEARVKDTFEDEIADAVIRLLDMAGGLGIDLEFHINAKVQYNRSRTKLHGKNY